MNTNDRFFLWVPIVILIKQYGTYGLIHEISSNLTDSDFDLFVEEVREFVFEYSYTDRCVAHQAQCEIKISVSDDYIVKLIRSENHVPPPGFSEGEIIVQLKGKLPGRIKLYIKIWEVGAKEGNRSQTFEFPIQVNRVETIADVIFTSAVILITGFTNVGIGCEVDLDIVKQQLKTPTNVVIGLCCQYIIMPLIAYSIVENSDLMPGIKLGFFALGCSPGGSGSNAFAYLLGGNVSLSITMTFVSTLAAIGLLPLWLFTLGPEILEGEKINIPYHIIMGALAGIIVPTTLGVYIRRKHPRWAQICIASIKYFMLLFILFCFTVGVWINWFVFQLMRPPVLLASAFLPYTGFLLGGLTAFLLGRDKVSITTIAIETGIQNTGVPIVMMRLSLTGPERDTSVVGPVASSILVMIPFGIALVTLFVRNHLAFKKPSSFSISIEPEQEIESHMQLQALKEIGSLES